MKNNVKVSVVCAWYNRAEYIKDTVNSLLNQNFNDYEIILVNDGSTDIKVKDILDSYSDPKLTVIHQENTGFVGAIKRAIENATGEFIAIQGAGDVSLEERLSTQFDFLDANKKYGIVGCRIVNVEIGGENHGKKRYPQLRKIEPGLNDLLLRFNPFSHGEVMFRKEIYNKVGGYRDYFKHAQDRDLWIRMAEHTKLHVIDKLLYERRSFHVDGVSTSVDKAILQAALSTFARQCYYDRKKMNGLDFVDLYPNHALVFRRKNKNYANFLAKLAIKDFLFKEEGRYIDLPSMAINEYKTFYSVISYILKFDFFPKKIIKYFLINIFKIKKPILK